MVTRDQIQALADDIAAKFPEVEKIILFGSYAYGEPSEDSDVDLMVLMNHRGPGYRSASRLRIAVDPDFPFDLLVRSVSRVAQGLDEGDTFIRQIFSKGAVLYEKEHGRVDREGRDRFRRHRHPSPIT